jgi:ParB family transcriptional regulator, chromosome partitioning protein
VAKGLGKGINALFAGLELQTEEPVREIDIRELRPNPYQPRKVFNQEAIEELKESILQHGILQPIVVRKSIKGYEIVVGERRLRAAKEAKLKTVPVIVRDLSEKQMMELALLENLQREDLTPIEEALAYQMMIKQLNITQEQLAVRLGKSRPHIANHLRLLNLPESIQQLISNNQLSMGHGRALLSLKDKERLLSVAQKSLKEGWNVRQLEQYIAQLNDHVPRATKKKQEKDLFIKETESILRESFGTPVTIKQSKTKGKIEIEFFSQEDLERLLDLFQAIPSKDE